MEQESQEDARRPAYRRLGFRFSAITFPVVFGLLPFGGFMEIGKLVNMLRGILDTG